MQASTLRKTKIVCSIGPVSANDEVLHGLIDAGMNVARFNFSHGTHEWHGAEMERVKRISAEMKKPVAILLDTKGPEIRTGDVKTESGTAKINAGDEVLITVDGALTEEAAAGKPAKISLSWVELPNRATRGIKILIADGLLELCVEDIDADAKTVTCKAENTAVIGSKKNVNLIGLHAGLPILSEKDKEDIVFGAKMGVDFIAASFVSFPKEVTQIRDFLRKTGSRARIIAKIENEEGVKNIAAIARLADGVMVARGDLGVQIPMEQIPIIQKNIISMCRVEGKPVITATQMLDSMIVNPRPTRAELTDVSNAIFDGTDAVMLSGETAQGAHPVEAVTMMSKIALTVENSEEYRRRMRDIQLAARETSETKNEDMGLVVARSGYETANSVRAKVIVTPTLSGNTARLLSTFRASQPILAVTPDEKAIRYMQLLWGVVPCATEIASDSDAMIQNAAKLAYESGMVAISEKIVMVAGLPLHSPMMVNSVRVLLVGNVLMRAEKGFCADSNTSFAVGKIISATSAEDANSTLHALRGKHAEILVCPRLTSDYIPIIRLVKGVLVEDESEIDAEILRFTNPHLVWLTGVKNAMTKLESGLSVTIDGEDKLVYEGTL